MAAGLGFKTFTTGEVLTSADTNGYLMQGVLVFADAAARDAAITSPQEGQFAYLKDTDVTTYYTASAWANLDTTGMTNPMTTTADMIYSSSGSTPARLGIGTVGQVLTVNSGATAPEWATAASGGGLTLINSGGTALSGASTSVTSIPGTYKNLHIYIEDFYMGSNSNNGYLQLNGTTSDNYAFMGLRRAGGNSEATATEGNNDVGIYFSSEGGTTAQGAFAYILVPNYAATNHRKIVMGISYTINSGSPATYYVMEVNGVLQNSNSAITSIQVVSNNSYSGGTVYVYGEN